MRTDSRPSTIRATVALVTVGVFFATAVPLGGASPPPGTDNPWLQRRIAPLAHAGGEDENPQETLYAFGRAREHGVPILDMDVQFSADGVPIVMHDDTVDDTTNGSGPVHTMTAAELNALDAAYWFTEDCAACQGRPTSDYIYRGVRTGAVPAPSGYAAADFGVPSLEQVFQRFPDAYFDIEIKQTAADVTGLARATADLIHEYGLSDRVVIASFGGPGMPAFRAAAPDVATSGTLDEVQEFFLHNTVPQDAQILDVPPTYEINGTTIDVVTPDFVKRAHAAGLAVWVWMDSGSQQNAAFYDKLLQMGVDGLNVSRPDVLMDLLNRRGDAWDPDASTPEPTSTTPTIPATAPPATAPSSRPAPAARPVAQQPAYTG